MELEDKKIILESYLNLFDLIAICQKSKGNYNSFNILDGMNKLKQLFLDIKENKICLNTKENNKNIDKNIYDIYYEMVDIKYTLSEKESPFDSMVVIKLDDNNKVHSYCVISVDKKLSDRQEILLDANKSAEKYIKDILPKEIKKEFTDVIKIKTLRNI